MKDINPTGKRRWRVLLALTLALCAAAGCAASESQPVVTEDDLAPFSIVTEPAEGAGETTGGGTEKSYAYDWPPEHIGEALEQMRREGAVSAVLQEPDATTEEQLNATMKLYRSGWEEELALNPAVPPQEAADLAGRVFEELYGVDLTGKTLCLTCFESDGNMLYPAVGGGVMRKVWAVRVSEEDADTDRPGLECTMDATTGEIFCLRYMPSHAEFDAMMQTPPTACYSVDTRRWNEADPALAPVLAAMREAVQEILSGSVLTGGAAVTEAKTELAERETDLGAFHETHLLFTCENGSTYLFVRLPPAEPYPQYDFDGYPLRGYAFFNDTYLQE